jgi:hypothetical protein
MDTGSTTTKSQPWKPQATQYKRLFKEAEGLLGNQLEYFPGSTIADRNPWSTMANRNIAEMVQGGAPGLEAAVNENRMTSEGRYLSPDSNPYLRATGNMAAEDISRSFQQTVMPGIASRFGGAGRSTGPGQGMSSAEGAAMGSANRDLGQELSQMYANLYGGAYEAERGRMGYATQIAPGLRGAQFGEQAALSAAGADEFNFAQMQLSDMVNRWNFEQYEPYESLGLFQNLISQPQGYGTQKQTSKLGTLQKIGIIGGMVTPSVGSLLGMGGEGGGMPSPGGQ